MDNKQQNIKQTTMSEFYQNLRAKLWTLTGLEDPELAERADPHEPEFAEARHPILCLGQPGIGKTAGIISTVESFNQYFKSIGFPCHLGFKKIQLGQTIVGDFSGVPVVVEGNVKKVLTDDLPTVERDGEYGVLFLDEITSADTQQVQPALGLCDSSREISGIYKLPEHWLVVAAGNGPDCSNFVSLEAMTISRFAPVYDVAYSWNDFEGFARSLNPSIGQPRIHEDIRAFLEWKPEETVRPIYFDDGEGDPAIGAQFSCPRTWEALSDHIYTLQAREARRKNSKVTRSLNDIQFPDTSNKKALVEAYDPNNIIFMNSVQNTIGQVTGTAFLSFLSYKESLIYDTEKIKKGTEQKLKSAVEDTSVDVHQAMLALLSEKLITYFSQLYKQVDDEQDADKAGKLLNQLCTEFGNTVSWFIHADDEDDKVCFITKIVRKMGATLGVLFDVEAFRKACPDFEDFLTDHADIFIEDFDGLSDMYNS